MSYRRANVLFLPRVTESDLVLDDTIFDKKFVEGIDTKEKEVAITRVCVYGKIPSVAVSGKWTTSTNLHCWNCDLQFPTTPVFVPTGITENEFGLTEYEVHGNFCTFNCAQSYIEDKFSGQQRDDRTRMLKMLYKAMTGRRIEIIKPSPEKTIMERYSGTPGLSAVEYKEKINELNKEYDLGVYKMDQLSKV